MKLTGYGTTEREGTFGPLSLSLKAEVSATSTTDYMKCYYDMLAYSLLCIFVDIFR